MAYDLAVAIPTLIGSLLSCVASGLIVVCYMVLPQLPHFRHLLILNLAGADFVNSFNNSVSGIFLFAHGRIRSGPLCTANGFVGQLSVQGADFSILAIAIATVITLRGAHRAPKISLRSKIAVSAGVWLVPITTSFTALALGVYAPVSGNWCWISEEQPVLRYALTHGWRFSIILSTLILYLYLFIYFRRQFAEIRDLRTEPCTKPGTRARVLEEKDEAHPSAIELQHAMDPDASFQRSLAEDEEEFEMRNKELMNCEGGRLHYGRADRNPLDAVPISSSKALTNITSYSISLVKDDHAHTASLKRQASDIQKILLLNAYPIAYVILWLPGIINRLVEMGGGSSRVLNILQSSTQFVGLANAITYGYNEGIRRQIRTWRAERRTGRGSF